MPVLSKKKKENIAKKTARNAPLHVEGVGEKQCVFPPIPELEDGMRTKPATGDTGRKFKRNEIICIRYPGIKKIDAGKYIQKLDRFSHTVDRGSGTISPPWYDIGKFKSVSDEIAVRRLFEGKKAPEGPQALTLAFLREKGGRKTRRRRRTTSRA